MISYKNTLKNTVVLLCLLILANNTILTSGYTDPSPPNENKISLEKLLSNGLQTTSSLTSKISLSGTYTIQITGLPSVDLTIDAQRFSFRGCNSNSFPYEAYTDGSFKVTGGAISTRIFCSNDQDSKYVSAFTSAVSYRRTGSTITFYNKNNQVLALIISSGSSSGSKISLSGSYSATFSGTSITITFDESRVSFKGCNSNSLSYEAFDNGFLKITGPALSTKIFCQNDKDSQYISILTSVTGFIRVGVNLNLVQNNNVIVVLTNNSGVHPTPGPVSVSLAGFYRAEFSGFPFIEFNISATHISFSGCNQNTIPYAAYSDGTFKITGPGISTLRACFVNDFDRNYIEGLTNANSFTRVATTLTLFKSGSVIAILQQALNGTGPVTPPPTYIVSLAGNYTASFQQLPALAVTITQTTIGFRGCNTNSFPYEALANGQFRISGPGISTLIFCQNDKDPQYVAAFNSATSYTRSGNTITLIGSGKTLITLRVTSSVTKVSLVGQFYLSFTGLPSTTVRFDGTRLSFDGCNINSAQYEAYSDNTFKITSQFVTALRACLVKGYDSEYVAIFLSVTSFTLNGNSLILFSNGRNVASSTTVPTSPSVSLVGSYSASFQNLPEITITIDESRISFKGCNSNSLPYQALANGKFSITGPGISTLIACSVDYDSKYVAALQSVTGFTITNGVLSLIRSNTVIATLRKANEYNSVSFDGSYTLSVPNTYLETLVASIRGNTISFSSCNSISIQFEARSDGSFKTNGVGATKKYCVDSKDNSYIDAITGADGYLQEKSQVYQKTITKIYLTKKGKKVVQLSSN